MSGFYEAVYTLVRGIPRGRVMTYGQIATLLGAPRSARAVGYAMRASGRRDDVPWQRVINGRGRISAKTEVERPVVQKLLLEAEGVVFGTDETVDLTRFRWEPADPEAYRFAPGEDVDW